MTKEDVYQIVERILETKKGFIRGKERFDELCGWDSMAVLELLSGLDKFEVALEVEKFESCESVDDLISLLDEYIVA
jgi:acyl carrier protein|tara:strand:- start:195 stop:425 length:231 start_codon:yes stop_codon:yes gene_type:complete